MKYVLVIKGPGFSLSLSDVYGSAYWTPLVESGSGNKLRVIFDLKWLKRKPMSLAPAPTCSFPQLQNLILICHLFLSVRQRIQQFYLEVRESPGVGPERAGGLKQGC